MASGAAAAALAVTASAHYNAALAHIAAYDNARAALHTDNAARHTIDDGAQHIAGCAGAASQEQPAQPKAGLYTA